MPTRVWRLSKAKFASTPLSGEGARLYGGRWNHPGTALVYTSSTLALAQLEALVHFDRADAPTDIVAIELLIPDRTSVETLDPASLPRTWRRHPAPDALARLGTAWAASLRTAVLEVPSAVVPRELNYILNPAHPDSARIKAVGTERVVFDVRLFPEKKPRPKAKAGRAVTPRGGKPRRKGSR